MHHSPTSTEQLPVLEHPGQMSEAEWALKGLASVVMHPLEHKPRLPHHVAESGMTGLIIAEAVQLADYTSHISNLVHFHHQR